MSKGRRNAGQAYDSFLRALSAGVRHACGTDAGTPFNPHGHTPHEIVKMVEWGLPELRAMEAATANAAELLGVIDTVGRGEEGKAAELGLSTADPVEQIDPVLTPALVMTSGEVG